MNTRPSRSTSIPITRSASASSSARNIEDLISIPFVPPPARHVQTSSTSTRPSVELRRGGAADASRGPTFSHVSISPTRSSVRSTTMASSVPGRSSSRSSYEPRVVRGLASDISTHTDADAPQPSTSPSQARRVSASSLRASSAQKPIVPLHVVSRMTPVAFPRPTYLDYSSLRHLLQTEAPILPIPTRKVELSSQSGSRPRSFAAHSEDDDDNESIGMPSSPPTHSRTTSKPSELIPHDKILKLPTRWSDQERNNNLNVSPDGRDLSHQGSSTNLDKDAAAARTMHPIPPACGIYYYEVEVKSKEQKARVSVGFSGKGVKLSRLPGWESNSWGYCGDDGCSLAADKSGSQYGPTFGADDIIGCGIDFTTHRAFYTKNGTLLGSVFENVGKNIEIYPTVGLQHHGDSIRANFGQESFKYDIDYHVQQQYNAIWNKISETSLNRTLLHGHRRSGISIAFITNDVGTKPSLTEEETKQVLNQLVTSYLVHHGYAKTARALETQQNNKSVSSGNVVDGDSDIEMVPSTSVSDSVDNEIECRTKAVNAVLAGNIDDALSLVQTHYPSVLEVDDRMMLFKLRCRKFIELIIETSNIKKKIKALREKETEREKHFDEAAHEAWLEEEMTMDIDDDTAGPLLIRPITESISTDDSSAMEDRRSLEIISSQYESALNEAISYGQGLSNDYQSHGRPEVQSLFKTTFGIVAWEDPAEAGGLIAELVSHEARVALAHELNQAILKSQGRPAQPTLETVYRHASACVTQLGLLGVGAAAFADMPREFFQHTV